jgi:hypothetical protein
MPEEKLLFVEKKLDRWKRPESPRPGTAFVFVGDGKPPLVVYEGQRGPTSGELLFGKFSNQYYEVDMGERSLNFDEKLPSADVIEFHAEVKLVYAVNDNPQVQAPALIVRSNRTDAGQFLKDLAIDAMRRTSRRFAHDKSGDAENAIAARIEEEVRDKGFKLSRPAFVKLSLDETVHTILTGQKIDEYAFEKEKTRISRQNELDGIQQDATFGLKGKRAEFFAPYIKSGDWATLLAMLDPNNPEDEAIKAMIEVTLNQQKIQAEKQLKILDLAIEKGALEGWQLEGFAKGLLKEVSGLSEQSMALLEGKPESRKSEESPQIVDEKPPIPEEISREHEG